MGTLDRDHDSATVCDKGACFGISHINIIFGADSTMVVTDLQQPKIQCRGINQSGGCNTGGVACRTYNVARDLYTTSVSKFPYYMILFDITASTTLPYRQPRSDMADSFDHRQSCSLCNHASTARVARLFTVSIDLASCLCPVRVSIGSVLSFLVSHQARSLPTQAAFPEFCLS